MFNNDMGSKLIFVILKVLLYMFHDSWSIEFLKQ